MRLLKNFSTKKGSFGQFLIRIRIQDTDPDPNPGFKSGSRFKTNCRADPDLKLDPKLLFRICNTDLEKACNEIEGCWRRRKMISVVGEGV
jgi:hypothetical protein